MVLFSRNFAKFKIISSKFRVSRNFENAVSQPPYVWGIKRLYSLLLTSLCRLLSLPYLQPIISSRGKKQELNNFPGKWGWVTWFLTSWSGYYFPGNWGWVTGFLTSGSGYLVLCELGLVNLILGLVILFLWIGLVNLILDFLVWLSVSSELGWLTWFLTSGSGSVQTFVVSGPTPLSPHQRLHTHPPPCH